MNFVAWKITFIRSVFVRSNSVDIHATSMVEGDIKIYDHHARRAVLVFRDQEIAFVKVVMLHAGLVDGNQRIHGLSSIDVM